MYCASNKFCVCFKTSLCGILSLKKIRTKVLSLANIIWCHDLDCCQGNLQVSFHYGKRSLRALSSLLLLWIVPFFSDLSCTERPVFHYICLTSSWQKIFCFLFLNCQCCLHQAECTGSLRSYLYYKTHTSEIIMLLNSNSSKSFYFSADPSH